MRFQNEIVSDLTSNGRPYSIMIDRIGDGADAIDLADDWCRGYALGIGMREDEWKEAMDAPELQASFLPILALAGAKTPELDPFENYQTYHAMLDVLPNSAVEIAAWWRTKRLASVPDAGPSPIGTVRRAGPKISPNAPCPCGSGKKFKRCCSPLRVV
jgi:uncharacterized protein YecA (UPF0149 family)